MYGRLSVPRSVAREVAEADLYDADWHSGRLGRLHRCQHFRVSLRRGFSPVQGVSTTGSASRPAVRLTSRPDVLQQLSPYQGQALRIPEMGVRVLELPRDFLARSFEFRQQFGLLTNDSVIALQMRDMGLRNLASADQNFDRAQGILRFGPSQRNRWKATKLPCNAPSPAGLACLAARYARDIGKLHPRLRQSLPPRTQKRMVPKGGLCAGRPASLCLSRRCVVTRFRDGIAHMFSPWYQGVLARLVGRWLARLTGQLRPVGIPCQPFTHQ